MKRLLVVAALALQAALLFAEPVIGRSMGRELRMRDAPDAAGKLVGALGSDEEALVVGRSAEMALIDGMKAYWLRVIGVKGVEGWVYGGYLDADAGRAEEYSAREVRVEVADLGKAFGEGGALRVDVYDERHSGRRTAALLVRTAKAGAKVVFAQEVGALEMSDLGLLRIEFLDLVGDAGKEIGVVFEASGGDASYTYMVVYAYIPGRKRFVAVGKIDLGSASGGAGYGIGSGSSVEKGPYVFVAGGRKYAVVRLRIGSSEPISGEEGDGSILTTNVLVERRYELVGETLSLTGESELERSESGVPFGRGGDEP